MAVTFRLLTGSALTHRQMDTNLGSYYLSSSVSGSTITFFQSSSVDGSLISTSHTFTDLTGSDTTYTAGDHIDITNEVITNTSPDQIVSLTGQGSTTVTGTYPTFIISSSDTNDNTEYTAGTGIGITGEVITNTSPDQTVSLTGQGSIAITGTYPNFTISGSDTNVNTEYTAGTGLTLTGTEFSFTGSLFSGDYNDLINTPDVSLSLDTNNLTLTKLDGTTDVIDLTPYLDEDARAIASGTLDGVTGIVTFTRDDATTFTLDLSDLLDDTNLVTSVNGANGVVELDLQNVCDVSSTTSTTITAANFITTSDKRLKSDIKPIQEGLETIKKFVSYEYVKDGIQDAGFLAQEVKEAIPYSIGEREDGFLTMRDRPVLAHMHKAILELEARLAAIEEKLG